MKLTIEYNNIAVEDTGNPGNRIMITPPINEGYWLARVPVNKNQAVVAFPKFGVIGIGFQKETDWNTNLPSTCGAEEILEHIGHNMGKGVKKIDCLKAIQMLQQFAKNRKSNETQV
jgi:hypothetical protein